MRTAQGAFSKRNHYARQSSGVGGGGGKGGGAKKGSWALLAAAVGAALLLTVSLAAQRMHRSWGLQGSDKLQSWMDGRDGTNLLGDLGDQPLLGLLQMANSSGALAVRRAEEGLPEFVLCGEPAAIVLAPRQPHQQPLCIGLPAVSQEDVDAGLDASSAVSVRKCVFTERKTPAEGLQWRIRRPPVRGWEAELEDKARRPDCRGPAGKFVKSDSSWGRLMSTDEAEARKKQPFYEIQSMRALDPCCLTINREAIHAADLAAVKVECTPCNGFDSQLFTFWRHPGPERDPPARSRDDTGFRYHVRSKEGLCLDSVDWQRTEGTPLAQYLCPNPAVSVTANGQFALFTDSMLRKAAQTASAAAGSVGKKLFSEGTQKFLFYDRPRECYSMFYAIADLNCALQEAKLLKRTLVIDADTCVGRSETGAERIATRPFSLYWNAEHLSSKQRVVTADVFFAARATWIAQNGQAEITTVFIRANGDVPIASPELSGSNATLIWRHFGNGVKDSKHWFQVCDSQREWPATLDSAPRSEHIHPYLRPHARLVAIAEAVAERLGANFTFLHVWRGNGGGPRRLAWPRLSEDTQPEHILEVLGQRKVPTGPSVYISTDERNKSFFDPLRAHGFRVFFLDDFSALWGPHSHWRDDVARGFGHWAAALFDPGMRALVEYELSARTNRIVETFGELTTVCRDWRHPQGLQLEGEGCKPGRQRKQDASAR